MQPADVLGADFLGAGRESHDVSLPLSDPYDAFTTWKSAKHAHEERLKDVTGTHILSSTSSLEQTLAIKEKRAARHRREIQELERIERQREQRERDAAEERKRMGRKPLLAMHEKSLMHVFERLRTPEEVMLPLARSNICSLQALAFLDHRKFAEDCGLSRVASLGSLERALALAVREARRTISVAIIDSLTLLPDREWDEGQRRVAAAMIAEAERRDFSENSETGEEDLQDLDDDVEVRQRQKRREERRKLRRERQRLRRERAAQIPRGPYRRALIRSVTQWHDFLETEPGLGDRLATRFGEDGPVPTWKETSAWTLWMLRSQLTPGTSGHSPRSRRTKSTIDQCLKHAKNQLWFALFPALNKMPTGEWRLYWMRVEQSFALFFTQNSRMRWKEAAASDARTAALKLGKSREAQDAAATRAVNVVRSIMDDRDLTPPKSLSPRRTSTSPVRTTSPLREGRKTSPSREIVLYAPLDMDDAVRKRMGLTSYLNEEQLREVRLKQQRRQRMQHALVKIGVTKKVSDGAAQASPESNLLQLPVAKERKPGGDGAVHSSPEHKNEAGEPTSPVLAPAGYAIPDADEEGTFSLVKAGPAPGQRAAEAAAERRLSRESAAKAQESAAKAPPASNATVRSRTSASTSQPTPELTAKPKHVVNAKVTEPPTTTEPPAIFATAAVVMLPEAHEPSDTDSDSSDGQIKVNFIDGGRKMRHESLPTWTSAQLAAGVCDDLVANGRMREKPEGIRKEREKSLAETFQKAMLDGARMKTITSLELDVIIRRYTKGQSWVEDVQAMLKEMMSTGITDDLEGEDSFLLHPQTITASNKFDKDAIEPVDEAIDAPPAPSSTTFVVATKLQPSRASPSPAVAKNKRSFGTHSKGKSSMTVVASTGPKLVPAIASTTTVVASSAAPRAPTVVATKLLPASEAPPQTVLASATATIFNIFDTNGDGKISVEDIPVVGGMFAPSTSSPNSMQAAEQELTEPSHGSPKEQGLDSDGSAPPSPRKGRRAMHETEEERELERQRMWSVGATTLPTEAGKRRARPTASAPSQQTSMRASRRPASSDTPQRSSQSKARSAAMNAKHQERTRLLPPGAKLAADKARGQRAKDREMSVRG